MQKHQMIKPVWIRLTNSDYCLRYVVTNDGRSSDLQVWSLGEDSGELDLTEKLVKHQKLYIR